MSVKNLPGLRIEWRGLIMSANEQKVRTRNLLKGTRQFEQTFITVQTPNETEDKRGIRNPQRATKQHATLNCSLVFWIEVGRINARDVTGTNHL